MELLPYFLVFSAICGLLSYGFFHRPTWMWYVGWVVQYIMAGCMGIIYFGALSFAQTRLQIVFAAVLCLVGLLVWLPCSIWWAGRRHWFGKRKSGNEVARG